MYLVNKITWLVSYVSSSSSKLIEYDLPLPLPPVIMKYLLSFAKALYFGFRTTKTYNVF